MVQWLDMTHVGDCRDLLRQMAAEGVRAQTCVTSPPYFGLRDYGVAGQIGLEATPEAYVEQMVAVFRAVRDVLADDGTVWLNLGDSYGRGTRTANPSDSKRGTGFHAAITKDAGYGAPVLAQALPNKQLLGIPWRVAFALQADGWYLRQDIIWHKPNPMPESVTDRCTKAHEYLFLLAKAERYYYDADAIAEPASGRSCGNRHYKYDGLPGHETKHGILKVADKEWAERNRRTIWTVATQPFAGAHFATFPRALIEPCILASTSTRGHCPKCGSRVERQVERVDKGWDGSRYGERAISATGGAIGGGTAKSTLGSSNGKLVGQYETVGWKPTCECGCAAVPDVVLDPFMGSGTTGQVATDLGRHFVGCELNPQYVELHEMRRTTIGLPL